MKFTKLSILPSLLLIFGSQPVLSRDEDVLEGIKVARYPVSDIAKQMEGPKEKSASGIEIPSHMQYIVGLDQPGHVVKDTGITIADPEYAITLSAGDFSVKEKKVLIFSRNILEQKLNRCHGGFWTFFDNEEGKKFFDTISAYEDFCDLTFRWNDDLTEAKIFGYFESRVYDFQRKHEVGQGISKLAGAGFDTGLGVTIELQPYWKWKFGIPSGESFAGEAMDEKCCPAKSAAKHCLGPGTLGKSGKCETISMACGEVKEDDLASCAMYKRRNKFAGKELPTINKFLWWDRISMAGYLVYPLYDKYGKATPYNKFYVDAMKENGIENLFHGVELA